MWFGAATAQPGEKFGQSGVKRRVELLHRDGFAQRSDTGDGKLADAARYNAGEMRKVRIDVHRETV